MNTYIVYHAVLIFKSLYTVPVPRISMQPSGFFSGIIGEKQDIVCSVTITSTIDPSLVVLIWMNASSIITSDSRVTIIPTNVTANSHSFTYTTTIQFAYLTEADEGNYICNVAVNEMMESRTTSLQNLRSMQYAYNKVNHYMLMYVHVNSFIHSTQACCTGYQY